MTSPRAATLIVARLRVASSYKDNFEYDIADGSFADTVQWWIGPNEAFRIRTFAVDHDIHVHRLTPGGPGMVKLALGNLERTYKGVTWRQYLFVIDDPTDAAGLHATFLASGIAPTLELRDQFAWWNPDGEPYVTQSAPVDERHRQWQRESSDGADLGT